MSKLLKKALLDTDFLFKSYLAQNDHKEALTEKILEFKDYEFYIHEKIIDELGRRGFDPDPVPWLKMKIDQGQIRKYTDSDIIDEIETVYGHFATRMYYDFLKNGCDAFEDNFFETHYKRLIDLEDDTEKDAFLETLKICEQDIPSGNSMGEKKLFVLAQLLEFKYPGKVVVLCSDDGKARRRLAYIRNGIRGFSILAAFQKLKQNGLDMTTAKQYYDSLCSFYSLMNQKAMKVWKHSGSERISVNFDKLFLDLYDGKFEIKADGDLRYIID